ncbi:MAG: type I glyceraldehyde-3-phosphate dehydrogenase [Deltaproteobacteria bacterium]|nr:type I glyceraldehyde-3-phosphate dehydrogenase [Deltaproteobacteria bacterium]
MKTRIGINGLGRIGKGIIRAWVQSSFDDFDIVMINDKIDPAGFAHLLKYDSIHGRLHADLKGEDGHLVINGKKIRLTSHMDPAEIPWGSEKVDIVLECTGKFTNQTGATKHLTQGVKKVILSAPGKEVDATLLFGVNEKSYDPKKHNIISNASCTTNCLAPVAKVLHEQFKIRRGFMTTIHSYTNDQKILDKYHKDLRRARAGALSQIPTTTGAAKSIGLIMPELKGKLDGISIRVPTPNVSLIDLVCEVEKEASIPTVNRAFEVAAAGPLKGILSCCYEPLVSIDFNGNSESAIIDMLSTNVLEGHLVKILAWYDNEMGFSYRMVDLVKLVSQYL